jgi:5-methyltetrahydrofolate--homocysteine methyltransferase
VVTLALVDRGGALEMASGEPALDALHALASDGAAAVGVNCTFPGAPLTALVASARGALALPLIAKPSPGLPGAVAPPAAFGAGCAELARAGASWIGGCCGATADHLRAAAIAVAQPRG